MSTDRSDLTGVGGLPWPVEVRPMANAKCLRLRLDEGRGRLVLTHPRRMSRRNALEWAARQHDWVERQVANLEPALAFAPGAVIPIQGCEHRIDWSEQRTRSPVLVEGALLCGGPRESLNGRIERFLRTKARNRLSERTAEMATRAGVSVKSVSVTDTRSRWGSCSVGGNIRYNWRLIMAPSHVLDWVVAHEVAHRVHMNHGRDFRALEALLYGGDIAEARATLRCLGPGLKRIGRTF